ncbi:AI-2E family transporter [Corynebacterium kroppenstedtii]|uniref:AI-2E family transporter n=1 Tax=Corynebacterium sp. PCR 32 TaxID=3351342 RepID=UPI00309FE703
MMNSSSNPEPLRASDSTAPLSRERTTQLANRDTADHVMGVPYYAHAPLTEASRSASIAVNVKRLAVWCLRFLAIALAAVVLWYGLGLMWSAILPVVISIIVCTLLWPPVNWLTTRGVPHSLSAIVIILGSAIVVIGTLTLVTTSAINQSEELAHRASHSLRETKEALNGPPLNIKDNQLNQAFDQASSHLQEHSGSLFSSVLSGASTASSVTVTLGIVLMLTFFFLNDGHKFLPWVDRQFSGSIGTHLHEVLARSWKALGGFIRAQAIISFLNSIFIAVGLSILHVPLALALAVLNFFCGFIPIFGAFVAGAVAVVIAFVANGWISALLTALLIVLVHQIEGNVLSPILQSRAMNLHPVIILASVAIGGSVYGVIGAFLAVPCAAVAAVFLRYANEQIDCHVVDPVAPVVDPDTVAPAERKEENK